VGSIDSTLRGRRRCSSTVKGRSVCGSKAIEARRISSLLDSGLSRFAFVYGEYPDAERWYYNHLGARFGSLPFGSRGQALLRGGWLSSYEPLCGSRQN
jgi:hypothetical protein